MHLSGHYSNHSPAFTCVLDAYPDGVPKRIGRSRPAPEAPRPLRPANGMIQRAVIRALFEAARPMDVGETQTAAERLLGHPVSRDSLNSLPVYRRAGADGPV
jgi:hypothetical protein